MDEHERFNTNNFVKHTPIFEMSRFEKKQKMDSRAFCQSTSLCANAYGSPQLHFINNEDLYHICTNKDKKVSNMFPKEFSDQKKEKNNNISPLPSQTIQKDSINQGNFFHVHDLNYNLNDPDRPHWNDDETNIPEFQMESLLYNKVNRKTNYIQNQNQRAAEMYTTLNSCNYTKYN